MRYARFLLVGMITLLTTLTLPITVWFSWEGEEVFKALIERFSRETGIEVKVVYIPKRADDKLLLAWKGGKGIPDVVMLKNDEIGRLIDILEPLKAPGEISQKSKSAFTINGKLYALPLYADIGGIFFYRNLEIPENVSIEWLVENLKDEKNALLMPIYGRYFFQVFQRAFGEKTDLHLKDESTEKALEYLIWIRKEVPYIPKDGRSAIQIFMRGEGKVLMFGSFLISKFKAKNLSFEIMEPPFVERAGRRISPNLDYKGFAVVKGRLSEDVKKFLEYVSSEEFQREFCGKLYKIPTNVNAQKALKEDPIFSKLIEYEKYGSPTPSSTESWKYYEAINAMLRLMMGGVEDVDKLLEAGRKVLGGG